MTYFTPGYVIDRLGVDPQTLRNWCKDFEQWLEPRANPEPGSHRRFTENDLSVLALVHSLRRDGLRTDEIQAALSNNQRGQLPEERSLATRDPKVNAQIEVLQTRIVELMDEIERLRPLERRNVELEALLVRAESELKEVRSENSRLNREIGRLTKD